MAALSRAGAGLAYAAVALAPFAFLAATPPLAFGFWPVNTGPLLAARLCGALAWAALALIALGGDAHGRGQFPVIGVVLGGLGLFAATLTLFHPSPALSLAGSPTFGDGAVWWIGVAGLAACAAQIAATALGRFFLGALALAAVSLEAALHLAPIVPEAFAPYGFSKVMGWALLAAVAITLTSLFDGWRARLLFAVCLAVFVGFALVINARALTGIMALCAVFGVGVAAIERVRPKTKLRSAAIFLISMIVITHPIFFNWSVFGLDRFQILEGDALSSMLHRFEYWWALALDIDFATAGAWLGHGWGGVQDALARQFLGLDQMAIYAADGGWRPNMMDAAEGFTIHSHNMLLEAWHGGGVIFMGAFAAVALVWLSGFARWAPLRAMMVVAMLVYASVWYMVPAHIGLFAIALGALAGARAVTLPAAPVIAAAFALLVAGVGLQEARRSIALDHVVQAVATERGAAEEIGRLIAADEVGVHLHEAAFVILGVIGASDGAERAARWRDFERLWAELERRISADDGPDRLALGALVARGHLLDPDSETPPPPAFAARLRTGWFEAAYAATATAPARRDLVAQPLGDLVLRGDFDALGRNSARLLARDANDPVGLWFAGLAQITGDERGAGFARMARALDLGVGRFFPVAPQTAAEVRRSAAAFGAGG